MNKLVVACLIIFIAFACTSPTPKGQLSAKGKIVKVVSMAPSQKCEVVGKVIGQNDFGSVEVARNDARNQIADLGATHVIFQEEFANGPKWEVHGLGYLCPN